jgi:hypothetical protein
MSSGSHSVTYSRSIGGSFPGGKPADGVKLTISTLFSAEVENALSYIVAAQMFFKEVHRNNSSFTIVVL